MKRAAGIALSLGWIIVCNLVLFIKAGQYLDERYSMQPWGTLLGTLLSFVSISITIYHIWKKLENNS